MPLLQNHSTAFFVVGGVCIWSDICDRLISDMRANLVYLPYSSIDHMDDGDAISIWSSISRSCGAIGDYSAYHSFIIVSIDTSTRTNQYHRIFWDDIWRMTDDPEIQDERVARVTMIMRHYRIGAIRMAMGIVMMIMRYADIFGAYDRICEWRGGYDSSLGIS